ncbi:anti-sigma factor domain-containing protein [Microbacterium sp. PA5]|uniref:anti-sigma factor n=1 Tax=Microbacterium sp. PA5 TaxID=3416654 RepID=UPI003CF7EB33
MNIQDFADLSAGRALGALSPDDEAAFQEALREHPEWQGIVDADLETAATLGESVAPVAPPLAMRSQLLRLIRADAESPVEASAPADDRAADDSAADDTVALPRAAVLADDTVALPRAAAPADDTVALPRAAVPADDTVALPQYAEVDAPADEADAPATPPIPEKAAPEEAALRAAAPPTEIVQAIQRRTWTRGMFALVASIALLVGIGWGVGAVTDALRTPPAVATLAQIEAAPDAQEATSELSGGGEATLHWSPSLGEAVIVASGLPEIEADRTFEMWFLRDGTPVSAGTFDSADGEATALLAGEIQTGDGVAVTVEQEGGSPDGAPTTDPIVAIVPAEA